MTYTMNLLSNRKPILALVIVSAILLGYYFQRAPKFNKETSEFSAWAQEQIQSLSKADQKKITRLSQLSISATNSETKQFYKVGLTDPKQVEKIIRILNLARESGLNFSKTQEIVTAEPQNWSIVITNSQEKNYFFTELSPNKLAANNVAMNLIQILRINSK